MKQFITLILLLCFLPLNAALQEVVYTVTSKSSVLVDGYEPVGAMAIFEQSGAGQHGQMTANNFTLFTLTGLQGLRLHSVILQMRSNSKAGAGELVMSVGEDVLWQISDNNFADNSWNGSFTTAFVPIAWSDGRGYTFDRQNNTLQIQITASENSLYVASYTIVYSTDAQTPCTLQFHTGSDESIAAITENGVGEGVVLPACSSVDATWYFMGWTLEPVLTTNDKTKLPYVYAAGERYYPIENQTLYALYANMPKQLDMWLQDTILETGYYLFVDSLFNVMSYGGVNSKGRIPTSSLTIKERNADGLCIFPEQDDIEDVAVYWIDFLDDSTALIKHVATDRYVGYPRTENGVLTKDSVAWNYIITADYSVVFYHTYGTEWVQLRAKPDSNGDLFYQAYRTTYIQCANILFNIADSPILLETTYTSFPKGTGLDDVLPSSIRITTTSVVNPERLLLHLCTLSGVSLFSTCGNLDFECLPHGVYILRVAQSACKIFVP